MENRNVFYEQTADAIVNAVKEFETMGSAPFKYEDGNIIKWHYKYLNYNNIQNNRFIRLTR